jgi:hypothetical protein
MTMTSIDLRFIYDHDISRDQSLETIEVIVRDLAPRWSESLRIWRGSHDQPRVQHGELKSAVIHDVSDDPDYIAGLGAERPGSYPRAGRSEIRGSSTDLTIVLSLDEDPFVRIVESVTMANALAVQVRRPRVEHIPAMDWARTFFNRVCVDTRPAWGVVRTSAEYEHKNKADAPGVRYIGLNINDCLSGLYAYNFYGPTYTDLIGRDTLLTAPALESRPVGDGVLLVVAEDPERWDAPEAVARNQAVLDHLGRQYFFAKTDPPERYQAPTWPDPRPKPAPFLVGSTPPVTGPDPRAAGTGGTRKIHVRMILSSLDELADQDHQRRVWIAGGSSEQSSFVECFSVLYDDSGLGDALDANKVVFGEAVDGRLRELAATLSGVDARRGAAEIIDDPTFEDIRTFARRTAQMIRDLPR